MKASVNVRGIRRVFVMLALHSIALAAPLVDERWPYWLRLASGLAGLLCFAAYGGCVIWLSHHIRELSAVTPPPLRPFDRREARR